MKISAKTEYACVAMLELASCYDTGGPVQVRKIAERHAVPSRFLVQIMLQLKAAGLVDTLSGPGPFTVFAPTDEAFAELPAGTLEGLLKDVPRLKQILLYHVVPGKNMAADVVKMSKAKTAEGRSVRISTSDGVKVDGANVVKADVPAANGVIHVIDAVILPR